MLCEHTRCQEAVRNVHELPKKLMEDLRSALKAEEEVVPTKTATRVAIPRCMRVMAIRNSGPLEVFSRARPILHDEGSASALADFGAQGAVLR